MFTKTKRVSLAGVLAALVLAGCKEPAQIIGPKIDSPPSSPTPSAVLNVGVFLPLQGKVAASGDSMLNGLILAAEQANAGGGVLGHPVRLVVRDTKSQPDRVEKAVRDLPADQQPIHHSDRGCQYCSHEYVGALRQRGLDPVWKDWDRALTS